MGFPASHLWRHRGVTIGKTSGIPDSRWLTIRHFRGDQFEKNCSKSDFSWFNRTARAFFFKWLSWFLRYVLAFRTHVLKTHVLEHAFWWILFSNNLWFIKFTHHDMLARLLGWSGFWFAIQPSKHNSTCQPSNFNCALLRRLSDGFGWDFLYVTHEVGPETFFVPQKTGLRAFTGSKC